jgi:serine/threonine protein kinase
MGDRGGEYVCQQCRGNLLTQDMGLRRLFQEAARGDTGALPIRDYELAEKLGEGGMGAVYRATRRSDGRQVAIKVMLPRVAVEPHNRDMFLREIAVTAQLVHPNLVRLLEHGAAAGAFYFVMEHCRGGSVDGLMRKYGGRLPLTVAAPIMRQCLEGLEHAHQLNFIHRDLKPHNVLLAPEQGGGWVAKISDFGLAKNLQLAGLSGMTTTGHLGGTYFFMPREQLTQFKYFLPVSDLWSMAATFYNMLAGQFPLDFPANRDYVEVLLQDDPVPIRRRDASVPPALASLLDRSLSFDISQRPQSATEFKLALQQALRY